MSDLNQSIILGMCSMSFIGLYSLAASLAKVARAKAKQLKLETEHERRRMENSYPSPPQDTDSK